LLEHRLRETLENVALVAVALDCGGRVTFANAFLLDLLGRRGDEVVGQDWFELAVPVEERDGVRALFEAGMAAGGGTRYEHDLVTRAGERRTVSFSNAELLDAGGSPEGTLSLGDDVTERRREDALRRGREELFRMLIENASDVIAIIAADGRMLFASPALERVLGWLPDEVADTSAFGYIHPDDLDRVQGVFADVLAGASPPLVELRLRHRTGSWRTVEALGRRREYEGETVVVVNYRDVTDQRDLRDQLYHAQRLEAVGRLAGGIAHDFNNLLTAIGGYGELLVGGLEPDDPRRDDALEIVEAARRATALTTQLLAFSRRQVLETEVLDVAEIVVGLGRLLSRLLGEKIALVTTVEQGCFVRADRSQLEQVLTNLAVNARDAMPGGGRLEIDVRCAGDDVVLTAGDTGHGMDADTLTHIFEPFFTTKGPGRGTGLGLSTVYGIVVQSGGEITVSSEPGAGARFRVTLPLTTGPAQPAPAAEREPGQDGEGSVLVAEDEETIRRLVREALTRSGYTVHLAANADQALALLVEHGEEIDLLLTDVVMPGMSGPELARAAARVSPSLRVLYTSGYASEPDEAFEDPDVEFIGKPFSPEALVAKVREVLAR
jgi:PAS domain S-box-containing protein